MLKDISQIRPNFDPPFILKTFLTGLLIILFVAILILSWVPPVSRDALTHHLALPKLYLAHGGIYEIPTISFSYYPMNLDLLYLIALYFGSDIAPKFIHFSFALLCVGLIYGYLKRRLNTLWGLVGALMFLSLPVIVKLSITAYVDLGLIFFSTASLIFFMRWIEEQYQIKYLILSAIFCGLALGTKYNGLLVFMLLALFVPFVYSRKQSYTGAADSSRHGNKSLYTTTRTLGYTALFILISLLIYSPWFIRNMVWTHNPVYPLYKSRFTPQEKNAAVDQAEIPQMNTRPGGGKKRSSLSPFLSRKILYNEAWWQVMLVPVRIFFQGKDDNPQYFDGQLHPYLFILPFFAFLSIKKNPPALKTERLILLAFSLLYLMFTFFTVDMRIRYVAPIIPPLVILAVFGLNAIVTVVTDKYRPTAPGLSVGLISVLLLLLFSTNAAYISRQFNIVDPFSYLSGRLNREAYIEKYRPEYPVFLFANQHLAKDDKILGLFLGKRRYYSDREIIFKVGLFRRAVKNAQSANEIVADLKQSGITHLIIRFDIFKSWSKAVFDIRQKEMLRTFYDSNLRLIFTKGGYGLYQLKTHSD
ncbi:MAG: ArnT family glycosyltransferase [Planctomycetota bacterium]|jgi:4-amino-4-deoxy-L-arabinose transferase-like glycosyltransferase